MANLIKMMKRAASSVIPLANRTPYRSYTSAIPMKTSSILSSNRTTDLSGKVFRTTSIPPHHHFSDLAKKTSDSDDRLVGVIETEIDCAEEELGDVKVAKAPREFPFKVEDNAGQKIITLTRECQGDEIKVTVQKLHSEEEEEDQADQDDDEEEEEEEEEESGPRRVELDVSVIKKNGQTLRFKVSLDGAGIIINSLAVKKPNASAEDFHAYEGPDFSNLDLLVRESFRTYLQDKGIEPSSTRYLHDYIIKKELKEKTAWLKKLKKFIAN